MPDDFDEAVAALYGAAIQTDSRRAFGFNEFRKVRTGLLRLLHARYDLRAHDLNDAISEATLKFIRAVRTGRVQSDKAAAYITTIALHEAENLRRGRITVPLEERLDSLPKDSDEESRIDDQVASSETIAAAIRALVAKGESRCARIIAVWLDEFERLGHRPSNREVALAAGVSHPTVSRCLKLIESIIVPN